MFYNRIYITQHFCYTKLKVFTNKTPPPLGRGLGGWALCQQFLYLLVDILASEAEFLVEHLVRSGETEALQTPYGTVGTYQSFKEAGCSADTP